jgi:hypothetical protein
VGAGNLIFSIAAAAGTDEFGNAYPAGISSTAGNSTIRGTDYILNATGMFFYVGTPGPDTLVMTIASTGGLDPFGTQYGAGFYFTDNFGAYASLAASGGIPAFVFQAAGLTHSTLASFVQAQAVSGGGAAEQQLAVFSSGKSGGDDAALQLFSEAADASAAARAVLEFGGAVSLTVTSSSAVFDVPVSAPNFTGTYAGGQAAVSTVASAPGAYSATYENTLASAINGIIARLNSSGLI